MRLEYINHKSGDKRITIIRLRLTKAEEKRFVKETGSRRRWAHNAFIVSDEIELPGVDKREHLTFVDIFGAVREKN